jgi:hypothetical protein
MKYGRGFEVIEDYYGALDGARKGDRGSGYKVVLVLKHKTQCIFQPLWCPS